MIPKLSQSYILHWKNLCSCVAPLYCDHFCWFVRTGMLPSFLKIFYICIILFIHFVCCLAELCRNTFDFSHTSAVVTLSMKFSSQSRAVCFRDGGCNRYIPLCFFFCEFLKFFFLLNCRGCLFYGPPGTGKTLVARALANECSRGDRRVTFFMRSAADCMSKWVGESERQLRLVFEQVRLKHATCSVGIVT